MPAQMGRPAHCGNFGSAIRILRYVPALFAAALILAAPALAADMNSTDWSEIDSSNKASPPDGWPTGMLPNQTEATARAGMGANKRFYDHINATATTTGTANAQILIYTQAPTALVTGDVYRFFVGSGLTNTGPATLEIEDGNGNALGPTAIQLAGNPLSGGELTAGRIVTVVYDGTNFQLPVPGTTIAGAGDIFSQSYGSAFIAGLTSTGALGSAVQGELNVTGNSVQNQAVPSGVLGRAKLQSSGGQATGVAGICSSYSAGVCTNELDSFNYFGAPTGPSSYPLARQTGTSDTVPVALTLAASGTYPSATAEEIGTYGQTFNVGIYEQPAAFGACCSADTIGLWADADTANGPAIDALFRNPGTGNGTVLQSTNSPGGNETPALAVEAPAASGNGPGSVLASIAWDGDISTAGHLIDNAPQASVSACGTYTGGGSDISGTVFPGSNVSTCTVTFARAYAVIPNCIIAGVFTGGDVVNITGVQSPGSFTVGGVIWNGSAWVPVNFSGANGFSYLCIQ